MTTFKIRCSRHVFTLRVEVSRRPASGRRDLERIYEDEDDEVCSGEMCPLDTLDNFRSSWNWVYKMVENAALGAFVGGRRHEGIRYRAARRADAAIADGAAKKLVTADFVDGARPRAGGKRLRLRRGARGTYASAHIESCSATPFPPRRSKGYSKMLCRLRAMMCAASKRVDREERRRGRAAAFVSICGLVHPIAIFISRFATSIASVPASFFTETPLDFLVFLNQIFNSPAPFKVKILQLLQPNAEVSN